jgi:Raf kinase inhibitor-like YbhB/YbcL family protein
MKIESPAFSAGGAVPKKHTCQGPDVSPPLSWSGAPVGTRSFVLVVDDPDAPDPAAPKTTWIHWILYDIPAGVYSLREAVIAVPAGARHGKNSWGRTGYGGPCPPIGRHRYFHKIFALDTMLGDLDHPTIEELEDAMKGHVVGTAELIGTYQKE